MKRIYDHIILLEVLRRRDDPLERWTNCEELQRKGVQKAINVNVEKCVQSDSISGLRKLCS
jgi:hypothetical protein